MNRETRHGIILMLGTGLTAAFSLVYAVYAGRLLGPAGNADFVAAITLVAFCNMAFGPVGGTVTRFTAQFHAERAPGKIHQLRRRFSGWIGGYGLLLLALVAGAARPLSEALRFHSTGPLLIALGIIYLTWLVSVGRGVLRGAQLFGGFAANTAAEAVFRLAVGVALLAIARSVQLALAAYLFALGLAIVLSHVQLRRKWGRPTCEPIDHGALRRYLLPMFVMMAASAGYQNVDMLVAKNVLPDANAGIYGAAHTLTRVMAVLATPFSVLLLPLMTDLHQRQQRVGRVLLRLCGAFVALAIVPLLAFALWSGALIQISYGPAYAAAAPLLFPLAVARLLAYLTGLVALMHASRAQFGFLVWYAPMFVLELAALLLWGGDTTPIIHIVLGAQVVVLVLMCIQTALYRPAPASIA